MSEVFIAGVSMTRFGPLVDDNVKSLTRAALLEAISDAGAKLDQIEVAFFANQMQGVIEGQTSIPGQIALSHAGLTKIPVVNVENACASGASAFWLACSQVRSGAVDVALAIGAEKMVFADVERQQRVMAAFSGGLDVYEQASTLENLASYGRSINGESGIGHRTVMMDLYASLCRAHMARFGSTRRQLAVIASKNHDHAALNDRCHFRKPFSVEEVLAGRALAYPLTVPMCSPLSDGGSAAIVCNRRGLQKLARSRPRVRVDACELASAVPRDWTQLEDHIARRAALSAYEKAGVGPDDVDLAEVHDAAAFGELLMSELLGFCPIGEGGLLAESGATRIGGRMPINTSGGLESKGHPIGATGLAQIFELTMQLRGEAGTRQVDGAQIAMQENGGGFLGVEEGAAVITILSKL